MARLVIGSEAATVVLRSWEHALAFHGDVRLPLTAIVHIRVPDNPWMALRGWRSTGVGIPGLSALGVRRHGTGRDFTALSRQMPAVLIEMNSGPYEQVMVSVPDAGATADVLASAAGIARS